ncbi:MarR family winged helix-turn-helix transcriptional regulator [Natronoglycomyces albus]|uniref:MarR family transcriptional regulator n=1 Tax=Natronoglycomyces albus TaxID=2811108 RepID=A0A895XKN3_9ACTN|nr:MarR family transcriptional regulator [Natronoglycomyces albus]QSB05894.1 MarR family transcriptional regulator [Natronoglycomyces albus]
MDSAMESVLLDKWHKTLTLYHELSCALESTLQELHGLGLSEFEVLERLRRYEAECERGSDECALKTLESRMHLSQSALSRTVSRLTNDGLVIRDINTTDRRAAMLKLTDEGRAKHEEAKPSHREVLAKFLD